MRSRMPARAKPGAAGRQRWLGATGGAVANLDEEVAVEDEADLDGGAGGMPHGVRQPLLNDAACRFLHGWRELASSGSALIEIGDSPACALASLWARARRAWRRGLCC